MLLLYAERKIVLAVGSAMVASLMSKPANAMLVSTSCVALKVGDVVGLAVGCFVGALVAPGLVGASVVGASVVGASVVGASVVGASVVGAMVVSVGDIVGDAVGVVMVGDSVVGDIVMGGGL
eukprot:8154634-Pyramimonas_sp.AAC.1